MTAAVWDVSALDQVLAGVRGSRSRRPRAAGRATCTHRRAERRSAPPTGRDRVLASEDLHALRTSAPTTSCHACDAGLLRADEELVRPAQTSSSMLSLRLAAIRCDAPVACRAASAGRDRSRSPRAPASGTRPTCRRVRGTASRPSRGCSAVRLVDLAARRRDRRTGPRSCSTPRVSGAAPRV